MTSKEYLTSLPFSELIQPHPKACTPTNMAYLISLAKERPFKDVLGVLLRDPFVFNGLYGEIKGISFPEIVGVVNAHFVDLGVQVDLIDWVQQPRSDPPFIIGVKQLPLVEQLEADQLKSVESAQQVASLVKQGGVWEYPNGHAITVVENTQDEVVYFDSYLGERITISRASFIAGLRDEGQLIKIK